MDCVMAPQTLIPDLSRLKDQNYYLPFINHLKSHLDVIQKFSLHLKSTNNYYFDNAYMYKDEFKQFRQYFNELLYSRLNPILEAGIIEESDSCCNINPNICENVCPEVTTAWLKLLNSLSDIDFIIILDYEANVIKCVNVNSKKKNAVKVAEDWYKFLDEITYFRRKQLNLAIEIVSREKGLSIDKKYDFEQKFYNTIEGLDDKTARNILVTLADAVFTFEHRAEKMKDKENEYRKDCNNGYRIHYVGAKGKIVFLHYGSHKMGL